MLFPTLLRTCITLGLADICFSTPTNSTKLLECANGNIATKWDGCIKQNSLRVRCPKNHLPCNDLARNGKEFSCFADCSAHGGVKNCSESGSLTIGMKYKFLNYV